MEALIKEAERQGVKIQLARDLNGALGYYSHFSNLILIQKGLHRHQMRYVTAHELGHSYYCHTETNARTEYQADVYATKLLIDPNQYSTLELVNDDPYWIASEMEVSPKLIRFYRQLLSTRL